MEEVEQQAARNAVVVGSGGIASALVKLLLADQSVGRVFNLQRGGVPIVQDSRLETLYFEATDADSLKEGSQRVADTAQNVHLLVNTVGVLHDGDMQPEKRLAALEPENLLRAFAVNSLLAPMLAQAFSRLMKHKSPAVFASLSARVGSISDNNLGGWYSYRASKAAHNMLLKTLANEWRLTHRNVSVLAFHPGTVATRLSEPFIGPAYKNPVLEPEQSAQALLEVIDSLEPGVSGIFMDWQGQTVDW